MRDTPTQPTYTDKNGVLRFQENAIVVALLALSGASMNTLAAMKFSDEDRRQFAQLIGYSVDDYCDLSCYQGT